MLRKRLNENNNAGNQNEPTNLEKVQKDDIQDRYTDMLPPKKVGGSKFR